MAHFNFHTQVSELTRLDAPLQKGPKMRWQCKAEGLRVTAPDSLSVSPLSLKSAKTPGITPKTPGGSVKTSLSMTPGKTPGARHSSTRTPGKHTGKTPGKSGKMTSKTPNKKTPGKQHPQQDRFIPNRSTTDLDSGHFTLMGGRDENTSPTNTKSNYQHHLSEAMNNGQVPNNQKILSFQAQKPPKGSEGYINKLKVLYSSSRQAAPKKNTTRHIPQQPDRILDAPELLDDYYLNLLDWSCNNHLAVALGPAVYLWNAASGTIVQLMEMASGDDYVTSVSWIDEGNIVAVGTNSGCVQLWDVGAEKLVRTMSGHAARVGTLAWNSYIVSSGARSGSIHHHDVRVADHHVGTLQNHTQEVCGLKWSPDGKYLASGGNDNLLNLWDSALAHETTPLHSFSHHQAAVKAISWCPWQPQLLASGGGTADRCIRFWNVQTGACLNTVETNSQVCSILWSKEHKELISGHGFSQFQLTLWKYPSMNRIADLTGHTARVLCLTMSPDGTTVASAAADETIRLWKCFAVDKVETESTSKSKKDSSSSSSLNMMKRGIR